MKTATTGHNGSSAAELRGYVERIEKIEAERGDLGIDLKAVYNEARREGFDVKALQIVIRLRRGDRAKQDELDAVVETYRRALGDLDGTPLGEAAADAFFTKRLSQNAR